MVSELGRRVADRILARVAPIASVALIACRVGEAPPRAGPEPTRMIRREPTVRVGLKIDTAAVFISSARTAQLVDRNGSVVASIPANETWTFTVDSTDAIKAAGPNGETASSAAVPLMVRPAGDDIVRLGERTYRGALLLRPAGPGRLSAINVLEMEQYLLGVVPREIGHLKPSEIEALKTQAIAARTYAIANLGSRESLGFDFYATVADQVYGGVADEDTVVSRAVRDTRGEIITYAGQPIIAYYASTCGGHTADLNEAWPWRPPQPYLKGRPDTDENGEAYCRTSGRYRWSVSWPGDSLRAILQQGLALRLRDPSFTIRNLEDVRVPARTESGRAEALEIVADGVTYRIPTDSIRWVLRPTPNSSLNSALLLDLQVALLDGEVTRLDVQGGGWGHGVGMCQVGAIGRARAGQSYREILNAYYSGIEIQRLY